MHRCRTRCLALGRCMRLQFDGELAIRFRTQEGLHAGYDASAGVIVAMPATER